MAGTILDYCGFDDMPNKHAQHRPGLSASIVCSRVNNPNGPFGVRCLQITPSKTVAYYLAGGNHTFTPGSIMMYSTYFRVDGNTPPPAANPAEAIVAMMDENLSPWLKVRLDDSFNLELYDSTNALLDSAGMTASSWKRLIILFEPDNANGDWAWYYGVPGIVFGLTGGTAAFGGGDAQADFSSPAGSQCGMYLGGQGGDEPVPGGDMDVQHGGCYMKDDVTNINDAVGIVEGKIKADFIGLCGSSYRIDLNSATPHCDEDGVPGPLDDLDAGTWDLAGDDNLATECSYTNAAGFNSQGGGVRVAAPANRQLDNIIAFQYIWVYRGVVSGVYGIHDGTSFTVTKTVDPFTPTGINRYERIILDVEDIWGAAARAHQWQMVQGIYGISGGKAATTHYFVEGYCSVLVAVPIVTGKPTIGKTANVTRGKRRWH